MSESVCPQCRRRNHKACTSPRACECSVCARLEWVAPPSGGTRRPQWIPDEETMAALRERPGEWCRVHVFASLSTAYGAAGRIRKGKVASLPPAEWEARSGRVDKTGGLWLRYVGTP